MAEVQPTSNPRGAGVGAAGGGAGGGNGRRGPTRQVLRGSAVVDAGGEIRVELGQVPAGYEWFIERVYCRATSTSATTFVLYSGEVDDDLAVQEFTPNGNRDVADESAPAWCGPYERLWGVWTGASATDSSGNPTVGKVRVQIRPEAV